MVKNVIFFCEKAENAQLQCRIKKTGSKKLPKTSKYSIGKRGKNNTNLIQLFTERKIYGIICKEKIL